MQENNFEKSVQQKLDGLHLTPSEPVWRRIEASVKKRRQRRMVLWMLPLLLLCGGLAWWTLASVPPKKTVATQPAENSGPAPTFSKPHAGNAAKTPEQRMTPAAPPKSESKPQSRSADDGVNEKGEEGKIAQQPPRRPHQHNNRPVASNPVAAKTIAPLINLNEQRPTEISKNTGEAAPANFSGNVAFESAQLRPVTAAPATTAPIAAATNRIAINVADISKISKPASKPNANSKWQWFITSRAGASSISEKFFSFSGNKSNTEAFSADAPPVVDNGSQFERSTGESPAFYTIGPQFSLGGGVKKRIGKRSFFAAGLQYSFYRNQVTAAPQLPADSIARSVYNYAMSANGYGRITSRFTNTFYFIEMPLGLEHQLLRNRRLHVQYGAAVSQMVAGNALRYDAEKNLYQQDDMALRKTGLALYTAVEYTVWKGRGVAFNAGPQVQYGVSNLVKNASAKSHLVSAGLAVTMAF